MATKNTAYQQLNVRIDTTLKKQAEDVLSLMGSSSTEFIRAVYEKVARGAQDYAEVAHAVGATGASDADRQGTALLESGWAIAQEFYGRIGYEPEGCASCTQDKRPWEDVYEETLTAHFEEKGVLQ